MAKQAYDVSARSVAALAAAEAAQQASQTAKANADAAQAAAVVARNVVAQAAALAAQARGLAERAAAAGQPATARGLRQAARRLRAQADVARPAAQQTSEQAAAAATAAQVAQANKTAAQAALNLSEAQDKAAQDVREQAQKAAQAEAKRKADEASETRKATLQFAQVMATSAIGMAGALDDPFRAMAQVANTAATAIGAAVPALQPVAAVVAAVTSELLGLYGAARGWAAALSPATIFSFNYALKNLEATLGQAVVPMFSTLIAVVDRFAGIISPAAQALAPVFKALAVSLGGVFLDTVRALADTFEAFKPAIDAVSGLFKTLFSALAPVFTGLVGILASSLVPALTIFADVAAILLIPLRILGEVLAVLGVVFQFVGQLLATAFLPLTIVVEALNDVFAELHDVTRVFQLIFRVLGDTIGSAFRAFLKSLFDMKPVVDFLKKALQDFSVGLVLVTARLALLFGATEFVKNLRDAILNNGREQGALSAPTNVHIADFASIARDLVTASYAAGPGGDKPKEIDYLKRAADALDTMLKNPPDWKTELDSAVEKIVTAIKQLRPTFDIRAGAEGALDVLNPLPRPRIIRRDG